MFFYISCPATLTIDLYTSILLPIVQRYVFTKLEVSTTFLFRENRRHDARDRRRGGATLKAAPREGRIIISAFYILSSVMRQMKTTHLRFTRERFGVAGEPERFSSAYVPSVLNASPLQPLKPQHSSSSAEAV